MNPLIALVSRVGVGLVTLGLIVFPVLADTYRPVEVPCPLGGANARGVEIMSQTIMDRYLDGEPIGHHGEPNPPPECPDNGFLVYKDSFSNRELSQIRDYIFSEQYQALRHQSVPTFYRLAKTFEALDVPIIDYYHYYLLALWEIPDGQNTLYRRYAREAIPIYQQALKDWHQGSNIWPGEKAEAHMALAELYRRTENFGLARKHLERVIENNTDLKFIHYTFIDYLDQLIEKKDSNPHSLWGTN